MRTDTPAARHIRDAVHRVLTNPSYLDNVRRIQADFARHNPPAEACALLERLAETKAPTRSTTLTSSP